MSSANTLMVISMLFLASAPVLAQQRQPTEGQCREAVNAMVSTMKSTPAERERDREHARQVIERVEKVVKENRARGVSECESWSAIGKIVARQ